MHVHERYSSSLGHYSSVINAAVVELTEKKIAERIWQHDHTVWKEKPDEIVNRLAWLHSPEEMIKNIPDILSFVDNVRSAGYDHAFLLGMGGSSLAPEVFRKTFGVRKGYLDLSVLDSTHPDFVHNELRKLNPRKTLCVVSTKSGGTVETFSLMKCFYTHLVEELGVDEAGDHFCIITDPGSNLERLGKQIKARKVFLNEPNIGGRYSVLSYFGLVPAALLGIDIRKLLDRAAEMAKEFRSAGSSSVHLGTVMGVLANAGRDKATFIAPKTLSPLGAWIEQLIAESTGKEGKGIFPVVDEEVTKLEYYRQDRLFIFMHEESRPHQSNFKKEVKASGYPCIEISLRDVFDLGGEFYRWEIATIIASRFLRINPFDQPNVESAKVLARKMVAEFQKEGALPELRPTAVDRSMALFADFKGKNIQEIILQFFSTGKFDTDTPRSYVAIQAYINPDELTAEALHTVRTVIQKRYKTATSLGFGPRFLHSTGQLHKGDAGNGLFVQIAGRCINDVPIPDQIADSASSMSFGVLIAAQALGDRQALLDNKRHVIRIDVGNDPLKGLHQLADLLS